MTADGHTPAAVAVHTPHPQESLGEPLRRNPPRNGRAGAQWFALIFGLVWLAIAALAGARGLVGLVGNVGQPETPCDWQTEYNTATRGQPGVWRIQSITTRATVTIPGQTSATFIPAGTTNPDTGLVTIDPRIPCRDVRQVVAHEAMHVAQGVIYGGQLAAVVALAPYGGVEINAECARSYLTGSTEMSGYGIPLPCKGMQLQAGVATALGHRV
jgi:hypothetical protein